VATIGCNFQPCGPRSCAPGLHDLLAGRLVARSLHRIRVRKGRVPFAEVIAIGDRVRYVQPFLDGRIAQWTVDAKVLLLKVDESTNPFERVEAVVAGMEMPSEQRMRLLEQLSACAECHSFGNDAGQAAPSLGGDFGRRVAAGLFDGYSDALMAVGAVWTAD
jgi:hypothetical protein